MRRRRKASGRPGPPGTPPPVALSGQVRIAYNVDEVDGRLEHLLAWLAETCPTTACLQELKTRGRALSGGRRHEQTGAVTSTAKRRNGAGDRATVIPSKPAAVCRAIPTIAGRYRRRRGQGVIVACSTRRTATACPAPSTTFKLASVRPPRHAELAGYSPRASRSCWRAISTSCCERRGRPMPDRWRDGRLFQPALKETILSSFRGPRLDRRDPRAFPEISRRPDLRVLEVLAELNSPGTLSRRIDACS